MTGRTASNLAVNLGPRSGRHLDLILCTAPPRHGGLGIRGMRRLVGPVGVSVIPRERDVTGLAGGRSDVNAVKLHPRMGRVVKRFGLQADHEDGREALLGE